MKIASFEQMEAFVKGHASRKKIAVACAHDDVTLEAVLMAVDKGVADAVLIGRPFVNMVYGGGAEGVKVFVDKLKAELADTMAMCGAHSLSDINRSMLYGF